MDFSILGPLELTSGGLVVELRRTKPRIVLAMLELHPNLAVGPTPQLANMSGGVKVAADHRRHLMTLM